MSDFTETVIAEAIDYIVARSAAPPDLETLAERAGYDPTYFQKIFRAYAGISPKKMALYMSLRRARPPLLRGETTAAAAHAAGLSGTGRLYDLFVKCEAVTPGNVRYKGADVTVFYGFHPTPLGEIMIGITEKGVCYLGFLVGQDRAVPLQRMKKYLPKACFVEDADKTQDFAEQVMHIWRGDGVPERDRIKLDLHGTNLQIQVWQALLQIPSGMTTTYKDIATALDRPGAARAIGNAVGANPVSLIIPCHRVIQSSGIVENYGWGSARKKLLLGVEGSL